MRKILFYISVILSGGLTAYAFSFANRLTATFDPTRELYGGGNGNPGLFMFVLFSPIIFYFVFAVILLFESFYMRLTKKQKLMMFWLHFAIASIVFTRTTYTASNYQAYINKNHPYMEVGFISQFSNDLLFNTSTYIGMICVLGLLAFLMPSRKKV